MKFLQLLIFATVCAAAFAADPVSLVDPSDADLRALGVTAIRHATISDLPAKTWETALMAGNGRIGALAMGRPGRETIIFSRAGVFLPTTEPLPPPSQREHLKEIRDLIAAGEYQRAADFVDRLGEKENFRGLRWTDPFVPICSLEVNTPQRGAPRDYLRSVDYSTGVVGTRWRDDSGVLIRKLFVSRADDVAVLSITSEGRAFSFSIRFVHHDPTVASMPNDVPPADGFAKVETSAASPDLRFRSQFAKAWPGSLQGAEAAARVFAPGADIHSDGDTVFVRDATEALVLVRVRGIENFTKHKPLELTESLGELTSSYGSLLARHAARHREMFTRMELDLGGNPADHRLPARRLFARSHIGEPLPALIEKEFDACRYLILSSSGDQFPPTLQGIWTGTWHPAWSGDYTNDGNLPVAISGDLPAAMPELLEGFFRYQESLLKDYRQNAQRLFGARGIVLPARSSSHGLANHFGPRWCLTFWTAGAGWMAHTYYDYWLYTGDRDFLRARAVPFMKEAALFYEDFLRGMEGKDGYAIFSPSYSPENDPANTKSQACFNATMDIAVARELFTNLVNVCEQEGLESQNLDRWRELLRKLPPYRINENGAIAEWTTPSLKDNYAHRHVSHLYELFDGLPDHIANDQKLIDAFRVALEKRTAWRRQIGGGEMAFGQAQMGAVAASLRMPDLAFENLDMLTNWFWFPDSMMTAHNPQSLFNTDIAGGIPQLITHMLIDSQPGWIELLPALPEQWPTGRIVGARCRGQIEIRELSWSPKEVRATLRSTIDQSIELRVRGKTQKVRLSRGADVAVTAPL